MPQSGGKAYPLHLTKERLAADNDKTNVTYDKKKVREKSREYHNHKPQPFPDSKTHETTDAFSCLGYASQLRQTLYLYKDT